MPIPRKKLPKRSTRFQYLVMLRCYMDDVPLALLDTRQGAERLACRQLEIGFAGMQTPSTPTHLVIIEFRNGLPNGQIVYEELMLGKQLLNL